MSKIKHGGLDHCMALSHANKSSLEQLVLNGLTFTTFHQQKRRHHELVFAAHGGHSELPANRAPEFWVHGERKPITEVWGSRGTAPGQGVRGKAPPKLNAFCIMTTREVGQFIRKSVSFCKTKSILPGSLNPPVYVNVLFETVQLFEQSCDAVNLLSNARF